MRFGIVVFPGSNCDTDCNDLFSHVLRQETRFIWHGEKGVPSDVDVVVLPGGFSYGDYLRAGALARFSPVMTGVKAFAEAGGTVIGICNGFQVLVESGLLPGALRQNKSGQFICKSVFLRIENNQAAITAGYQKGQVISLPIAHGEGNYYIDPLACSRLIEKGQILFRYCTQEGALSDAANPNGSVEHIAGICNERRNVFGMMPHPERASDRLLGGTDGVRMFQSFLTTGGLRR